MKKLSYLLFATVLLFASCSKDDEPKTSEKGTLIIDVYHFNDSVITPIPYAKVRLIDNANGYNRTTIINESDKYAKYSGTCDANGRCILKDITLKQYIIYVYSDILNMNNKLSTPENIILTEKETTYRIRLYDNY